MPRLGTSTLSGFLGKQLDALNPAVVVPAQTGIQYL
jgi:hypothetical protein